MKILLGIVIGIALAAVAALVAGFVVVNNEIENTHWSD